MKDYYEIYKSRKANSWFRIWNHVVYPFIVGFLAYNGGWIAALVVGLVMVVIVASDASIFYLEKKVNLLKQIIAEKDRLNDTRSQA